MQIPNNTGFRQMDGPTNGQASIHSFFPVKAEGLKNIKYCSKTIDNITVLDNVSEKNI